ncbi:MAG: VanZ family protein [Cryomorphaceae bacterium]|jgi:VanZ family protein
MSWFSRVLRVLARKWLIFSLFFLATITTFSLTPLPELPFAAGSDKLHHFVAYAALMFPAALRGKRRWFLLALVYIAWSGGIELIQPYVNRYGEWLDLLANSIGVGIGALIGVLSRRLLQPETST